jgi:hypothetical protein
MSFNLAQPVLITNASSNVDFNYGVYNSLAEAKAAVIGGLRLKGRTVGILESGSVVEYWWESGILDADLVPKGGQSEWGAITGTLSNQTDLQTALDAKVDENAAITGATKTKITYDSKGLVTAGADIAASDLPTGIDATKIADGSVNNTEFQYINGLTSDAQTQITNRLTKYTTTFPSGSNKNIFNLVALNQTEYNALAPVDANTLYFII